MREPFTIEPAGRAGRTIIRGAGTLLLLAIAGIIALSSTSCVRTGHVGVVSIFGRVTGRTLSEGIHIVNPVASVTELSVKTQEIKEKASVPSKEGLIMGLEASILYHLDPARAATVYQQMGPTYADILLIPTFRSAIRAITAGNTAASLYSDGREGIAQQILEDVRATGRTERRDRGERPAPRSAAARDAEARDRGQAAGPTGSAADGIRAAAREAGGRAQTRGGRRHQGLPGHRHPGDQREAARVERHRGDNGACKKSECQGDRCRQLQERFTFDLFGRQAIARGRYAGSALTEPADTNG